MTSSLRNCIKASLFGGLHSVWRRRAKIKRVIREWDNAGRPVPPPHVVKREVVLSFARNHGARTFVETGTYKGVMVSSVTHAFNTIYSIELDKKLYQMAKQKFHGVEKVRLFQGDSSEVLGEVLGNMQGVCVFWLDAHFSGGKTARGSKDTPIIEELDLIISSRNIDPIILIDDARHFTGEHGYPTLEFVRAHIKKARPSWLFSVKDDIVRVHSKVHRSRK